MDQRDRRCNKFSLIRGTGFPVWVMSDEKASALSSSAHAQ
jgi:hypothetical protein